MTRLGLLGAAWAALALAVSAHAQQSSSPRIFNDLVEPPHHGASPADAQAVREAIAAGAFTVDIGGETQVLPPQFVRPMLDSIVKARGGTGAPTAADSATGKSGNGRSASA